MAIQKKTIGVIMDYRPRDHTNDSFNLKLLNLKDLYNFACYIYAY